MTKEDESIADFMKKELIKYIKQEIDKDHPLWAIKRGLIEGGHHKNLIEESIDALKKHDFNVEEALKEPAVSSSLKGDLKHDVHAALKKYINYQIKRGYSLAEIKEVLLHYGHSSDDIKNAIDAVSGIQKHEKPTYHNIPGYSSITITTGIIVSLILLIFFLSVSSGESIHLVIIGFLPTIISSMFAIYMVKRLPEENRNTVWAVPVILAALLFIAGLNENAGMIAKMDTGRLAIVNLLISLIYISFTIKIPPDAGNSGRKKIKHEKSEVPEVTKKTIKTSV